MSTPGLINPYTIFPGMPQSFHVNGLTPSSSLVPFQNNTQPMTLPAGVPPLPFMNSCDLASQLMSTVAYNFIGEADLMNTEKVTADSNLSIRVIMSGKEVGSIIGKRGDNIKKFREESMARINISDGNYCERIVTISGNSDQIYRAIDLMCKKLEEDSIKLSVNESEKHASTLSIRLLIHPIQYNAIINHRNGRISHLKELNGITMCFGVDFLQHSSERLLTISGSSKAIVICITEICKILIKIPYNTYAVPYTTSQMSYPGMGQPIAPSVNNKMTDSTFVDTMSLSVTGLPVLPHHPVYPQSFYTDQMPYHIGLPMSVIPLKFPNTIPPYLSKLPQDSMWKTPTNTAPIQPQNISREFYIENEMIGCIIGRGGSTINEIRALSGAQIKISNCEDGKQERKINIYGSFEAVQTAQMLINSRVTWELLRWNL